MYGYAHSAEVEIQLNKKIQLDHFHYRVNQYFQKENPSKDFYLQTYEDQRLIINVKLERT